MNEYLNKLLSTKKEDYVIASDTDSIYLNLGPLVNKFFSAKSGNKTAIVDILGRSAKRNSNLLLNVHIRNCRITWRRMTRR